MKRIYATSSLQLTLGIAVALGIALEARATSFSLQYVSEFKISDAVGKAEGIAVATVGGQTSLWVAAEGTSRQGGDGIVVNLDVLGNPLAAFSHPFGPNAEGIAFDPVSQNLLITDTGGNSITGLTGNPGTGVTAFERSGTAGMLNPATPTMFLPTWGPSEEPEGVAIHPNTGNLWIADEHDKRIYEFDDQTGDVLDSFSISGLGGISGASGQGPEGLAFFDADHLLIADDTPGAPAIHLVSITGDLGDAKSFEFCQTSADPFCGLIEPEGLAYDPIAGLLYILNADEPASCNPVIDACGPTVFVAQVTAPLPEPGAPTLFGAGVLIVSAIVIRVRRLARVTASSGSR